MYFGGNIIPAWLGIAGWAATGVSLLVAGLRLRRAHFNVWGMAGAAAFIAALRLIELPLHVKYTLGSGILAVGFAVLVFGPEAAVWFLAVATVARGAIALRGDAVALGASLVVNAALAPWLVAWGYGALARAFRTGPSRYVLAFAAGAAGPAAVAVPGVLVWLAAGAAAPGMTAARAVIAAFTLAAAEGALATWGYALALERPGEAEPRAAWAPGARAGAWMAAAAVALAAAFVPLAPAVTGVFGKTVPLARFVQAPYALRAIGGGATVAVGYVFASIFFALMKLVSPRAPKQNAGPTR